MAGKLKVGVILDSPQMWSWQWSVLQRLVSSDFAELSLMVFSCNGRVPGNEPSRGSPSGALAHATRLLLDTVYRLLEAKIPCKHDAFRVEDGRVLAASVPALTVHLRETPSGSVLHDDDLTSIEALELDVLVSLTLREFAAPSSGRYAKCGLWYFSRAEYQCDRATPIGFWEVYFGWPASAVLLNAVGAGAVRQEVLAHSVSATNRLSVKLNRSTLFWKASCTLIRELEELHRLGVRPFLGSRERRNRHPRPDAARCLSAPNNLELAVHIIRNVSRRSRELVLRKLTLPQWILSCYAGNDISTAAGDFHKLVPPKDRYWADPHVIERQGKYYVFIEEHLFASPKAHIAVLEIQKDGRHSAPVKVLERPYHLSYPFVFEHDGGLFMVPESSANRTIELYRCVQFPDRWVFVRNLMEDVTAVDSTLLHRNGKWWLFTNLIEHPGAAASEDLFLFHADCLFSQKWTAHPLNPVVSDVSRSRPGGPILDQAGTLYRVCQDCSVRYGYAIRISQITELSEAAYSEVEVAEITPDWDRRIVATHTLSYAAGMTVIDCLQPRLRLC